MIRIDKRVRSLEKISKNLLGEFKAINSLQDEQMPSHHIVIFITDILTLPHDAVFGHLQKADVK